MTVWLLTWLWQGGAIAIGVAVALRAARQLNAATRYVVWVGALVAVIWLGYAGLPHPQPAALSAYPGASGAGIPPEPFFRVPAMPEIFVSIFLGVWAGISIVGLVRLLSGLHGVHALRDRCRPFPADVEAQLPLWLEASGTGRRAALALCDEVAGATFLGFQRPCIAVPSSLVMALAPNELDLIVLHEHAHAQRRDDWARLAQSLLHSVLWIHPAAAIIGRQLDREREMACDEWVVARTGLPKVYARCLAHAAEVRGRIRVEPLLASSLFGRRHDVVRRVNRLLAGTGKTRRHVSRVAAFAAACGLATLSVQLRAVPAVGELGALSLPPVGGPAFATHTASLRRGKPIAHVLPAASMAPVALIAPIASNAPTGSDALHAPITPVALDAPVAPIAPGEPIASASLPLLEARALAGAYYARDPRALALGDRPGLWRAAATPGVAIAAAAKKTSAGIANVFSRAGVSLARSF